MKLAFSSTRSHSPRIIVFGGALLIVAIMIISQGIPVERTSALQTSSGASWTSFTLDYNDSRYQADTYINASNVGALTPAWFFPANHSVTSTPLVENGHVYFADWGGNIYSLDLSTGSDKGTGDWNTSVVGSLGLVNFGISSTLDIANGVVYAAGSPLYSTQTNRSILFALNQSTGALLWTTTLRFGAGGIYSSPIYYNGLVYVGESDCHEAGEGAYCDESIDSNIGEIFAVNTTNHLLQWSLMTGTGGPGGGYGGGVWGSVAIDPALNSIYFGTGNSYNGSVLSENANRYAYSIMSLNAMTGKLNWNYTISPNENVGDDNDFGSTPNLFTLVYRGMTYHAVGLMPKTGPYYILNRQNGALITTLTLGSDNDVNIGAGGFIYPQGQSTSPEIFLPASNGYIKEYDPANSSTPVATSTQFANLYGSEVALVPGAVLIGDTNGNVYAFNTNGLNMLWNKTLPDLHAGYGIQGGISVAGAYLFVGDDEMTPAKESPGINNGGVYAFSLPPQDIPTTTTATTATTTSTSSSSSSTSTSFSTSSQSTSAATSQSSTTTTSQQGPNTIPFSTILIVSAVIVAVVILSASIASFRFRRR